MNKLLKYGGYLFAFIIVVFILLNVLDKMGVGCLYNCKGDNKPTYGQVNNYVNGKKVN
jgi:hypothetical protein